MTPARHRFLPTRADLAEILRLASPIVAIQVGLVAMGVVDSIMVGRVSAEALAAVALGNLFAFGLTLFGVGVLLSLDPIIAQALGAGDTVAVTRGVQRGLLLAALLTVPPSIAMLAVVPALTWMHQPAEVVPLAASYVYRLVPAVLPGYLFVVFRQTLQAHRQTRDVLITIVVANLANVVLNYAWIYGHWGFQALGVVGSAWSTLVCRWLTAVLLLALGWRFLVPHLRTLAPRALDPRAVGRVLRLGAPIGAQVFFEWAAFGTVAFLMGALGLIQVAAHQVAITLASLTFMVPVGVSSAAAVIVGHAVGREDAGGARRSATGSLAVGVGFMTLAAIAFTVFPEALSRLYTDDTEVLAVAVVLLPIAGLFQIFDGIQAVALGVLRGLGDTHGPMLVSIVGFWGLGLPASVWLGYGAGLGAVGLWWGLVVGLGAVAALLLLRLRQRMGRKLARIAIDDHAADLPAAD
jgi:multidrug resistance protein, MATE family